MNRFWILAESCNRWGTNNDFVLVIYYTQNEFSELQSQLPGLTKACPKVSVVPFCEDRTDKDHFLEYPVNTLRNVGIDHLQTSHYLMVDVDFLPSHYLHEVIIHSRSKLAEDDKQLLIVPAFQRQGGGGETELEKSSSVCTDAESCKEKLNEKDFIPYGYKSLVGCLHSRKCIPFQYDNNPLGHSTTDSEHWVARDSDGNTEVKCFDNNRYEPYMVVRHCPGFTPYYDERFYGYGKNKIEMVAHLRHLDYKFNILNKAFIIHFPHPESKSKNEWLQNGGNGGNGSGGGGGSKMHEEMDKLYGKFVRDLKKYHGQTPLTPLCTTPHNHK
ncbi:hypothetical protein ScalyP_jg6207 [Parmales sp. scaly parma]|nr:hypothetical protein ScalyP_jg6207 [Parmales sp. scaly parma]